MARLYRSSEPYWTTAKFTSKCEHCSKPVTKGQRIFYFPNSRTVLCAAEDCGDQASRQLDAEKFDQRVYDYQY
jgi:hypothetical protein